MSDHVDGPRQIGDPAADLTDLFAFRSPENPAHMVIAANVFPSAGVTAMFSNAVSHSLVIRRVSVAGIGSDAGFKPDEKEYRFTCRFDPLQPSGGKTIQRGTMTCPDGQTLRFVVNDEKGASSRTARFVSSRGYVRIPSFWHGSWRSRGPLRICCNTTMCWPS